MKLRTTLTLFVVLTSFLTAQQRDSQGLVIKPKINDPFSPRRRKTKPEKRVLKQKDDVQTRYLRDICKELNKNSKIIVIPMSNIAGLPISISLDGLTAQQKIDALCNAYNLRYNKSEKGIIYLTQKEPTKISTVDGVEPAETIEIMYPRAVDVADTINKLYPEMIIWDEPADDNGDTLDQIDQALRRMDKLGERTTFDENNSNRNNSSSQNDYTNQNSTQNYSESSNGSSNDINGINKSSLKNSLDTYKDCVFMSVFPSTNAILLRSRNADVLKQIANLIKSLDKPSAQVLLEVKILEIALDNSKQHGVDWLFKSNSGNNSGGFTSGIISGPNPITSMPTGTGFDTRSAIFTHISDTFRARLELLQTEGRMTKLATPSLLVADNEASKIFVGTNTQYLQRVDVIPGQSTDGVIVSSEMVPVIDSRNIGTSLLITPKIHADRTVTLRIMQEYSTLAGIREIDYGGPSTIKVQDVKQQVVTTTVVAHDKSMLVLGGLISESIEENIEGIPWIMDLPYVGQLFQRKSNQKVRKELVLMVKPYILIAPGETQRASEDLLKRTSLHPTANSKMSELNITNKSEILKPHIINKNMEPQQ